MLIKYEKGVGLMLGFPPQELNLALGVLRGIYKVVQTDILKDAISNLEKELIPRKLSMVNYHHICQNCFRDLDSRDPNSFFMTTRNLSGEQDSKWVHYVCKKLSDNRPG